MAEIREKAEQTFTLEASPSVVFHNTKDAAQAEIEQIQTRGDTASLVTVYVVVATNIQWGESDG